MKKIARFVLTLTVSAPLISIAVASDAHYGEPSKILKLSATGSNNAKSYVTIYNYTHDTYSTTGAFDVSHNYVSMSLGVIGSPRAAAHYEINAPDNCVNLTVRRDIDGYYIPLQNPYCVNYSQPLPTFHTISINPGLTTNALPIVTIK